MANVEILKAVNEMGAKLALPTTQMIANMNHPTVSTTADKGGADRVDSSGFGGEIGGLLHRVTKTKDIGGAYKADLFSAVFGSPPEFQSGLPKESPPAYSAININVTGGETEVPGLSF